MNSLYDDILKELEGLKITGKAIVQVGTKLYEADCNYNPPKVTELEVHRDYGTMKIPYTEDKEENETKAM